MKDLADVPAAGRNYWIIECEYADSFVNDRFAAVNADVASLAAAGFHGDSAVDLTRRRPARIDLSSPATTELVNAIPTSGPWLGTVPTAAALHPLYEPLGDTLPNGTPIDPVFRDWLRNIADARGIRSRAAALQEVLLDHSFAGCRWLSLACGAAQPVIRAAGLAGEREALPELTLVDIDPEALALAQTYADACGLGQHIHLRKANILSPRGLAHDRRLGSLRPDHFDAVDAVGILEYLKAHDWEYAYGSVIRSSTQMAGAITFLRNAYDLVRPGGVLIVGNMRDTHPQLGFTLNVIQWPHIQPRSIADVLDMIDAADIDGDVEVRCPSDGVYALYTIRKPWSNAQPPPEVGAA